MLAVDFYRIHADQVARLREWMGEITARRNEALQTYAQEGVRHEMGYLLEDRHGPILVWVMEVHDHDEGAFRRVDQTGGRIRLSGFKGVTALTPNKPLERPGRRAVRPDRAFEVAGRSTAGR